MDSTAKFAFTVDSICKVLRDLGISAEVIETDSPMSIRFTYNDMSYRLVFDDSLFLSLILMFDFNPEEENIELMKDAAQYVSLRTFGTVVFVVPEDAYWVVGYDIYADSESYLQNNLNLFLDILGHTGWYFYEYYQNLKSRHSKL